MNKKYNALVEAQNTTTNPSEKEPERLYYFIKKCREIVKKKSEELGRPLTYSLTSFGCQMNIVHEIRKAA